MATNQLSLTGTFLHARDTETVGQNNFLVRSFYIDITTRADWPNTPEIKLKGDKVTLVDNLKKGDQVVVHLNLEGKKIRTKPSEQYPMGRDMVINEISAWKIEVLSKQSAAAPRPAPVPAPAAAAPSASHMPAGAGTFDPNAGADDDLPF